MPNKEGGCAHKFISRMTDKCLPFFKALRTFNWTEECQNLKSYLISSPLLMSQRVGETLYLYLATSKVTVATILIRTEGKVLQNGEQRYSKIEKLIFSLIVTTRKLRPYFQAHPVIVMMNHPVKDIIMTKYGIELIEFGIEYAPRTTIKAQILADFMVECSFDKLLHPIGQTSSAAKPRCWRIYVDGLTAKAGSRTRVLLVDPNKNEWQYGLSFGFQAYNNAAEYEVLTLILQLALQLGVRKLIIHIDS
ncbi:rve domain-containing protein/RVT_3 domain-containing protein [Gossypium australe]|uniref:Rve domain-containing protein/RVT_3 domain-containing protein n=1 Tax=Gossypium australe TaxID=47621 RepID=A0A5B6WQY9_9ROSI|nr:rve domain-containing protein/RVT_3 domain-containing protein [Gossypium australe]